MNTNDNNQSLQDNVINDNIHFISETYNKYNITNNNININPYLPTQTIDDVFFIFIIIKILLEKSINRTK